MGVITLTSDFGQRDHYVARIKASLLKLAPETTIIDISNEVDHFNIMGAAYLVRSSFSDFPEHTIHLIAVNNTLLPLSRFIVVSAHNQFFVASDNGVIPEIVAVSAIEEIRLIEAFKPQSGFHELDVLTKAAAHLANKGSLSVLGTETHEIVQLQSRKARLSEDQSAIEGEVIYIDHFGNAVTNIKKADVIARKNDRAVVIKARAHSVYGIENSYPSFASRLIKDTKKRNAPEGKLIALFNSSDYLQLAIYGSVPQTTGSAHSLLGLDLGTRVDLLFITDSESR
jgi:S-adenosylmethionine hydrolase